MVNLVLVVERIGYARLEGVLSISEAGVIAVASLEETEIPLCGLMVCLGRCGGGVRVLVRDVLTGRAPSTPVTLSVASGDLVEEVTASAEFEDDVERFLSAGGRLGVDGPFAVEVASSEHASWQASHVWLEARDCFETKASPILPVWLLPPSRETDRSGH